jgi:predicted amidohydrolase
MAPTVRDPQRNLDRLREAATRAKAQGATLLVTPELAITGYGIGPLSAGDVTGTAEAIAAVAEQVGLALVVGAALWHHDALFNCAVVADADGTLLDIYEKAHLYGDLDRARFRAGSRAHGMAQVGELRVATLICYDVEFPEAVRAAAVAGAHLVAVPTANMHPLGHVNTLMVATRALENGVYVGYANHCGRERDTVYVGHSVVAAPDGSTVTAPDTGEDLLVTPVDPRLVERTQAQSPYLRDRRTDLYGPGGTR